MGWTMYSSAIIVIISILFFLFLAIYKRDMLIKAFSLNMDSSANQLQEQLEQTANLAVKRLEEQISHLEYLLEEATEKMELLDEKLRLAEVALHATIPTKTLVEEPFEKTDLLVASRENAMPVSGDIEKDSFIQEESRLGIHHDKRRLILAMSEQGYNVTEIAKATGMGKGEIMLLLQLNKK